MKILYDPQIFTLQKFGGISRYFYEIIKNLDDDISYKLPLVFSDNDYLKNKDISSHCTFFENKKIRGKARIMNWSNKLAFDFCSKKDIDLVHPTYYNSNFLKNIGNIPFVVTVYDMIHEKYATIFNPNDHTTSQKRLLCEKASKIIAISHNTKKDLVEIFKLNPDKIEVIHLGQSFVPSTKQTLSLPEKYILFTGQRWGYKNFHRFIKVFALINRQNPSIKLICTGPKFTPQEVEQFKILKIENSILYYYATNEELAELYVRAKVFVFPSEYEGFGIPILESFACGCPIALSNSSCFPEIAEEAGCYFDPLDIEEMSEIVIKLIEDEHLREQQIEKGYQQLLKFSWKKTAKETCNLYKSII